MNFPRAFTFILILESDRNAHAHFAVTKRARTQKLNFTSQFTAWLIINSRPLFNVINFSDTRWTVRSKPCRSRTFHLTPVSSVRPLPATKYWTLDAQTVVILIVHAIGDRVQDHVTDRDQNIVEPMFKVQVRGNQGLLNSVLVTQRADWSLMEIPDCSKFSYFISTAQIFIFVAWVKGYPYSFL